MAIKTIAEIFRDYETDGDPSSPPHKPVKADIRDTLAKAIRYVYPGTPGAGDQVATWNAALAFCKANGIGEMLVPIGQFNFDSKPDEIDFSFRFDGVSKTLTQLIRRYSEADPTEGFITFREGAATGGVTVGCGIGQNITVATAADCTGGIGVHYVTDGAITGFAVMGPNITFYGTVGVDNGYFLEPLVIDGSANDAAGGQGIRDVDFDGLTLFAAPESDRAGRFDNVIGSRGTISIFGYVPDLLVTGGATDVEQSQGNTFTFTPCLGEVTFTNAKENTTYGRVNELVHGTGSEQCVHYGAVETSYTDLNPGNGNGCFAPTVSPGADSGSYGGIRNAVINGDMRRDTLNAAAAVTITNSYAQVCDRWFVIAGGTLTGTITAQRVSYPDGRRAIRIARSAGSFVGNIVLVQVLESTRLLDLVNHQAALSYSGRRGADFGGSGLGAALITGTGTDQGIAGVLAGSWTGWANVGAAAAGLTTSDQRIRNLVADIGAVGEAAIIFDTSTYTGTGGANDWFELTDVQLEPGPVHTAFERLPEALQQDMCERYRMYTKPGAVAPVGSGECTATTNARVFVPLRAALRVSPTLGIDPSLVRIYTGASALTPSAVALVIATDRYAMFDCTVVGATVNNPAIMALTSTGYIDLNSEL